ncbi:MAG: 2'-5' RNA ligase family protein [Planctomycetes bacterium]|nr:2'-5' RNA ligase family protein [Planctomycetota bacterium]
MAYAITLFFNPALESRLRRICNVLREEIEGAVTVIEDVKSRPHISLAVMEGANVIELSEKLRQVADRHHALPVTLSSVGLFPKAEPVFFLAPVVGHELLTLHADVWPHVARLGRNPWSEYAPGRFVPHSTLMTSVRTDQLERATTLVLENTFPITGELVELGLVEFAPVKPLMSAMLL